MNKYQFLAAIREKIDSMPQNDIVKSLDYYSEIIDDRMEEGMSEEEAVAGLEDPDTIAARILDGDVAVTPFEPQLQSRDTKKSKQSRVSGWGIFLIVMGFPLWLPILISLVAVIISVYVSIWAVIISLWAVFASVIGVCIGCMLLSTVLFVGGSAPIGLAIMGVAVAGFGVSVLLFFACKFITSLFALLTKKIAIAIKNRLVRKGIAK